MEDLYNPAEPDYSKMEISEKDEDFQKSFMSGYYQKKGFSAAKAKRLVEADEDSDEGLFEASKEALKELSAGQEKTRSAEIARQKKQNETSRREDAQVIGEVEKIVQKGKLNNFTVPTKEREAFYKHALSHMQRNPNGGYMFVQPVEGRQLEQQLQEMYFAYKKGDLSTIIQREVKSEGAKRLKRNVGKQKKIGGRADTTPKKRGGKLPLMDEHTE
jgi:hypothetical protein